MANVKKKMKCKKQKEEEEGLKYQQVELQKRQASV